MDTAVPARIRRVLDLIDRNPDAPQPLAELAAVAGWSPCHFHRQFAAATGMALHRYQQLARIKRAGQRLAFRDGDTITAIALDAGYDAPDAFARAFRRHLGQSPSAFRRDPDWSRWRDAIEPFDAAQARVVPAAGWQVTLADFPETPVAMLTHQGDPALLGDTLRSFIAWRRAAGLHPSRSATFNLFHDDPRSTPPADFRLTLCAATDRAVAPNATGVVAGVLPGGRCAQVMVTGGAAAIEAAALFLYRNWLPGSGEALRDHPLFCRRIRFFPDVPEAEATTALLLPLR